MEAAERRQPLRASKKPLRATGSGQEAASGELGSIDPGAGENGHRGAERRIVRRFCLQCSMPCMPVVSQAGNQVTWNHFFLWLAVSRSRNAVADSASDVILLAHMGPLCSVPAIWGMRNLQRQNITDSRLACGTISLKKRR